MVAVNNALIINIVCMLLECASYMHADCTVREYRRLPRGLDVKTLTKGVFQNKTQVDISECGQMCADEVFCAIWKFDEGNCNIFHSMKDKVAISSNTKAETYYETEPDQNWSKIYFVKSGSRINVASSFLGKGGYGSYGWGCPPDICPPFFRSSLIDVWTDLPIEKVKLSLLKENSQVGYLIFDGQGTNSSSWFALAHLLESSWKDLPRSKNNLFGIEYKNYRSFYISNQHATCEHEIGWSVVIEKKSKCHWHEHSTYPVIIYSLGHSSAQWNNSVYGFADALAIYITLA